jgi:hypothetical protein
MASLVEPGLGAVRRLTIEEGAKTLRHSFLKLHLMPQISD